MFKMCAYIITY